MLWCRTPLEVDQHIYQVLTNRSPRARRFWGHTTISVVADIPDHIWIGPSPENPGATYRVRFSNPS